MSDRRRFVRSIACNLGCLTAITLISLSGCNDAPPAPAEPKTGREVLERMAAVYRKAITYEDSGEVRFKFKDGDRQIDETHPWSIAFERPNKLRMHVYTAGIVCDGKNFWATLRDLPGQVLKLPAPPVLTQEYIYSNPALYREIFNQGAGPSVPLMFLLVDSATKFVLDGADEPKLLEPSTIDDARCYRVLVHTKQGDLIFWVDKHGYEIRRIEFPIDDLAEQLKLDGVKVSDLSVVADLKGARFGAKIDDQAFKFDAPSDARTVQAFNLQPKPLPLSDKLGKPIGSFRFTSLDGQSVTQESLAGKVVVLDFWATWCRPCFESLPEMQKVYERFKDDDRIKFLAVSIDRDETSPAGVQARTGDTLADVPTVTDAQVRDAFVRAKLTLPIVRDPDQQAHSVFGVEGIPAMFVIGPDGTVEDNVLSVDPQLATELPGKLERLLAGGSLHTEVRKRYDERMKQYNEQFQAADAATITDAQLVRGKIADRSEPNRLKLTKLWTSTSLAAPGNVLVVGSGDTAKIYVVDGLTAVAELDIRGELVAKHTLELPKEPEDGIVAFLRTAVDSKGLRWFVGAAGSRQQLHVFDDKWQRKVSYPEAASAGGIASVELGDLDGDGEPDMNVGFYSVVGVQNVTLDGRRKWGNRTIAEVVSLAVTAPDAQGHRNLWCANNRGTLAPIDYLGREMSPLHVGTRMIRLIAGTDTPEGREFLGIATTGPGSDTAVGIDAQGHERWQMPLPQGLQPIPSVEPIASGDLAGGGKPQWVVLGSNGSINVVAIDGTLVDQWNHGAAVSGIAVAPGRRLIVATAERVEMWQAE